MARSPARHFSLPVTKAPPTLSQGPSRYISARHPFPKPLSICPDPPFASTDSRTVYRYYHSPEGYYHRGLPSSQENISEFTHLAEPNDPETHTLSQSCLIMRLKTIHYPLAPYFRFFPLLSLQKKTNKKGYYLRPRGLSPSSPT